MNRRTHTRFFTLCIIALVVAGGTTLPGGGPTVSAEESTVDDETTGNFTTNFTVTWRANGTGNPQTPGAENVTLWGFARSFPANLTPMGNMTILHPAGQRSYCNLRSARTFGIDRNDNNSERFEVNPSAIRMDVALYHKTGIHDVYNWTRPDGTGVTWVEFMDEGESRRGFGGDSKDLYREDEIVIALDDCMTQPSRQGWYRWYGHLNGSNDGDLDDYQDDWRTENWFGDDPDDSAAAYSHWYYICECANRSDAEQKLGVPPQYHPDRNASVRAPNYEPGLNLTLYHPGSRTRPLPTETATAPPTLSPTPTTASPATPTQTATASSPASDGEAAGFGGLLALLALLGGGLIVIIASLYR